SQDYPEIGYKRVLGVIQLHRAYGSQRLNDACKRALDTDACSYGHIKNILKNNMDKVPQPEQHAPHIPFHDNIRGASTYN
ncbi:IS21 family transposase, partial [Sphingobacterium sp. DN00404]|nr:IS21 family transposase [Sphingobacterium micropteri]